MSMSWSSVFLFCHHRAFLFLPSRKEHNSWIWSGWWVGICQLPNPVSLSLTSPPWRGKGRQIQKHFPPSLFFSAGSNDSSTSSPCHILSCTGGEEQRLWLWSLAISHYLFFLLTVFPFSSLFPLHVPQSFGRSLLQCGLSTGHGSLRKYCRPPRSSSQPHLQSSSTKPRPIVSGPYISLYLQGWGLHHFPGQLIPLYAWLLSPWENSS